MEHRTVRLRHQLSRVQVEPTPDRRSRSRQMDAQQPVDVICPQPRRPTFPMESVNRGRFTFTPKPNGLVQYYSAALPCPARPALSLQTDLSFSHVSFLSSGFTNMFVSDTMSYTHIEARLLSFTNVNSGERRAPPVYRADSASDILDLILSKVPYLQFLGTVNSPHPACCVQRHILCI